jgi:hypothetical protein
MQPGGINSLELIPGAPYRLQTLALGSRAECMRSTYSLYDMVPLLYSGLTQSTMRISIT